MLMDVTTETENRKTRNWNASKNSHVRGYRIWNEKKTLFNGVFGKHTNEGNQFQLIISKKKNIDDAQSNAFAKPQKCSK